MAAVAFATVKRALRFDRSMLIFSLFPVVFSLHQFVEGGVWLSIYGLIDGKILRYLYIIIACLTWPVLSPLAALAAETNQRLKLAWGFLLAIGLALLGYQLTKIVEADGIGAVRVGHSISYIISYRSKPPGYVDYIYALATLLPLLFFKNRMINIFGIVVTISFLYSFYQMREVYFSVWCMSAALLSALVFFSIRKDKHSGGKSPGTALGFRTSRPRRGTQSEFAAKPPVTKTGVENGEAQ